MTFISKATQRHALEWNGVEWNEEWNGMEWNGMEWNEEARNVARARESARLCGRTQWNECNETTTPRCDARSRSAAQLKRRPPPLSLRVVLRWTVTWWNVLVVLTTAQLKRHPMTAQTPPYDTL